ncbi:MAG: L,D-transpeptidase [Beijerinckiaceae bacterium]
MFRRLLNACLALFALVSITLFAAPASAGVDIRVNLASQTMTVTTPDGDTRRWAVSSGRKGYNTIRGNYRPYLLKTYHWSRKYGGAMPNAIFFKGGYAIHGTSAVNRLGSPASHGCIRLAPANARELFAMVKKHGQRSTRIAINGVAPDTGKSLYAAKKQKPVSQIARVKVKQPQLSIPAYAPYELIPSNRPFQRLR